MLSRQVQPEPHSPGQQHQQLCDKVQVLLHLIKHRHPGLAEKNSFLPPLHPQILTFNMILSLDLIIAVI